MRDEGGDQVRLDLVSHEGLIGSVMVERSRLPYLAQVLLTAGLLTAWRMAPQIVREAVEGGEGYRGGPAGSGHSAAIGGANAG